MKNYIAEICVLLIGAAILMSFFLPKYEFVKDDQGIIKVCNKITGTIDSSGFSYKNWR